MVSSGFCFLLFNVGWPHFAGISFGDLGPTASNFWWPWRRTHHPQGHIPHLSCLLNSRHVYKAIWGIMLLLLGQAGLKVAQDPSKCAEFLGWNLIPEWVLKTFGISILLHRDLLKGSKDNGQFAELSSKPTFKSSSPRLDRLLRNVRTYPLNSRIRTCRGYFSDVMPVPSGLFQALHDLHLQMLLYHNYL